MKQRIKSLFSGGVLALALFGAALAGPLEDGYAAFKRGDYAAAMQIFHPLAEQGNASARAGLGAMYYGGLGVPQDYAQALAWFRKAADQGDVFAQTGLGSMYAERVGLPQDYTKALFWYRKAADRGYAVAQGALGAMYASGAGARQDYVQAHMWFNLAASRTPDAEFRSQSVKARDDLAAKMTPAQIAEAQRMARDWVQSHPSTR